MQEARPPVNPPHSAQKEEENPLTQQYEYGISMNKAHALLPRLRDAAYLEAACDRSYSHLLMYLTESHTHRMTGGRFAQHDERGGGVCVLHVVATSDQSGSAKSHSDSTDVGEPAGIEPMACGSPVRETANKANESVVSLATISSRPTARI